MLSFAQLALGTRRYAALIVVASALSAHSMRSDHDRGLPPAAKTNITIDLPRFLTLYRTNCTLLITLYYYSSKEVQQQCLGVLIVVGLDQQPGRLHQGFLDIAMRLQRGVERLDRAQQASTSALLCYYGKDF